MKEVKYWRRTSVSDLLNVMMMVMITVLGKSRNILQNYFYILHKCTNVTVTLIYVLVAICKIFSSIL